MQLSLAIASLILVPGVASAEDAPPDAHSIESRIEALESGLHISGFFDVTASDFRSHPNIFALGPLEIDLESELLEHFQIAAATVFSEEGAALAVGFIDIHLFGTGGIPVRGRLPMERGFRIQIGKFDVPFGNDWQYFAPPDRISITAPLTTDYALGGGMNDVGVRVLGGRSFFLASGTVLRGIGKGVSVGGRLGVQPFARPYAVEVPEAPILELGVSFLHDLAVSGDRQAQYVAFDLENQLGPSHLQAEYIRVVNNMDAQAAEGFHVTESIAIMDSAPFPLVGFLRYGEVDQNPGQTLRQIAAGVNMSFEDVVVLKAEYALPLAGASTPSDQSLTGQLVIQF